MKKKLLKNMEWSILVVTALLVIIGLFALFSATQSTDYKEFQKQLQWIAISIPFLILATMIDYNIFFTRLFTNNTITSWSFVYRSKKWGKKLV